MRDYHVSPTWKNRPPSPPGPKENFADVLAHGIGEPRTLFLKEPELLLTIDCDVGVKEWLHNCAVGDIKNIDLLHDLPNLLHREGFLDCEAKYVGGFRFLIECPSQELLSKVLSEGLEKLLQWFD